MMLTIALVTKKGVARNSLGPSLQGLLSWPFQGGRLFVTYLWICLLYLFIVYHWLCLSLTHSLTHWLTDSPLVNLIDVSLACEYGNSKLLKLLLLMLMMRIVLATVCCRFGSWGLVINWSTGFVQDFDVEVQARFWSWSLVGILLLIFGWHYEVESWSRFWSYLWSRF